jgi:hypothetical protein
MRLLCPRLFIYDVPVLGSIPAFTTGKRSATGKKNTKKEAK